MTKYIIITALFTLAGLCAGYFYAKHQPAPDFTQKEAISISRSGSFELDMTPDYALPLFTAPGEKLWIPVWDPTILNGDGYEKGTVFVTNNHGHTTYWTVLEYDTQTHHARYLRVTPDVDTGTVDVLLKANRKGGNGGSTVHVSYELTALSQHGNKKLQQSFSASNYAEMMVEWRSMINDSREKIEAHFSEEKTR